MLTNVNTNSRGEDAHERAMLNLLFRCQPKKPLIKTKTLNASSYPRWLNKSELERGQEPRLKLLHRTTYNYEFLGENLGGPFS